jgi:hypothetical protein
MLSRDFGWWDLFERAFDLREPVTPILGARNGLCDDKSLNIFGASNPGGPESVNLCMGRLGHAAIHVLAKLPMSESLYRMQLFGYSLYTCKVTLVLGCT